MSNQFIGEIRVWACNFAPRDWIMCNGQLLAIQQYTTLFSILGTTFGGDGRSTFGLPNFPGQAPMEQGHGAGLTTRVLGEELGESSVTLLTSQIPSHDHKVNGAIGGTGSGTGEFTGVPSAQAWLGTSAPGSCYSTGSANAQLASQAIGLMGASGPHDNMQPYLALNFCIAANGMFPPRG